MFIRSKQAWSRLWYLAAAFLVAMLLSSAFLKDSNLPLVGLGLICAFIVFLAIASLLSRPRWSKTDPGDEVRQMEVQGLLASSDYRATRAFQVEESEDEGSHYFIELEDGSVLYLNGQYLYDYEPINDDDELNQARSFPCTDFTVRRHLKHGYVLDIVCRGEVLGPEALAPPFTLQEFRGGLVPEDGQVIREQTYDQLRSKRLGEKGRM